MFFLNFGQIYQHLCPGGVPGNKSPGVFSAYILIIFIVYSSLLSSIFGVYFFFFEFLDFLFILSLVLFLFLGVLSFVTFSRVFPESLILLFLFLELRVQFSEANLKCLNQYLFDEYSISL